MANGTCITYFDATYKHSYTQLSIYNVHFLLITVFTMRRAIGESAILRYNSVVLNNTGVAK